MIISLKYLKHLLSPVILGEVIKGKSTYAEANKLIPLESCCELTPGEPCAFCMFPVTGERPVGVWELEMCCGFMAS